MVNWNPNAITLDINRTNLKPYSIYINTNNTIYVADSENHQILTWLDANVSLSSSISGINSLFAVFVSITGDIYIGSDTRVIAGSKWLWNTTNSTPVMSNRNACYGIFVDVSNTLYCSISASHIVVKKWLDDGMVTPVLTAGKSSAGSDSYTLNTPRGIFVDTNFDLYVADCGNNRVQLFPLGQLSASTVAGNGAANTIALSCPTGVVLDGDKYLFIVDSQNHRIVGSGPEGFRCVIGCFGPGSALNQLNNPYGIAFDSYGNIFVTDLNNNRIQKFTIATNSCSKLIDTSWN